LHTVTVNDEYPSTSGTDTKKEAAPAQKPETKVEPAKAPEPPKAEPAPVASTEDPLGGMDPLAWLESLAARQGAKPEELITSANLDIPVLPADTVIDEPGYTPGYDTGKKAEPAKAEKPEAKAEPAKAPAS